MESDGNFTIKVKATSFEKETLLTLSRDDTIGDLGKKYRLALNIGDDRNIRFIASGKMLTPPGATLSSFNIHQGSYVHAVISSPSHFPSSSSSSSSLNNTQSSSTASFLENGGQTRQLGGLDTLMNEGLTVNEVAALRTYFRPSIDAFATSRANDPTLNIGSPLPGESQVDFRARIETAWMSAQGPLSEFSLNLPPTYRQGMTRNNDGDAGVDGAVINPMRGPNVYSMLSRFSNNNRGGSGADIDESLGTYKDMALGFFFGFFFGFLSILCLWESNVPYRQKLGILLGVILQSIVGLLGGNQADKASKPTT